MCFAIFFELAMLVILLVSVLYDLSSNEKHLSPNVHYLKGLFFIVYVIYAIQQSHNKCSVKG